MALALDEDRADILRLVQTKMGRIAPNLSAVVGTAIAAQLMGVAGGLSSLSQMPACNIQVRHGTLGSEISSGPQKSVSKQFWVAGGLSSLSQKPACNALLGPLPGVLPLVEIPETVQLPLEPAPLLQAARSCA